MPTNTPVNIFPNLNLNSYFIYFIIKQLSMIKKSEVVKKLAGLFSNTISKISL